MRECPASNQAVEMSADAGPSRVVLVLLVVILVVGAGLRFYGLSIQSLWVDELYTWHIANQKSLDDLLHRSYLVRDVHPPLFFMLQYGLLKYVGDSETVMRLPSAVAGTLAVLAIYLLGRRLYSDTEGLIAAALTAVLYFPVWHSQDARPYSILFLLCILATTFWIPVVRSLCEKRRLSRGGLVAYIVTAVLTSYVHYFGLFLIGLQGLGLGVVLLVKRRRALGWLGVLYGPVVLAYVPWFSHLVRAMKLRQFWILPPDSNVLKVGAWQIAFMVNYSYVFMAAVVGLYAWLLARTLYDVYRNQTDPSARPATPHAGLLLVLWLAVPFVVTYVKSLVSVPALLDRNMIITVPAGYLLTARAMARLPLRRVLLAVLVAGVTLGLAAHLLFVMDYYSKPGKDQYRQAAEWLVHHPLFPEDSIIMERAQGPGLFDYYFRRLGTSRRVDIEGGWVKDIEKVTEMVRQRNPRYIWMIFANGRPDEPFLSFLLTHFTYVDGKGFPVRAGVLLFRNEPPTPGRQPAPQ